MISHRHRFIFIHIPKCAGTSVESLFGHFDDFTGRDGQDHRPIRMLQTPVPLDAALRSRENVKMIGKRFARKLLRYPNPRSGWTVTAEQYRSYYKFAIIRDPRTRLYSWYRNVKRDLSHRKALRISADITLEEFVDRFAGRGMLAPATWWLEEFDGFVRLDRLVQFESLATDFECVCRDLGLSPVDLPLHNAATRGTSLNEAFTSRCLRRVEEIYANELARFNY